MNRVRPVFIWLSRLAVAAVFLGACIAKIRDPELFALAVNRYRILPGEFVNRVAIVLPWIELTAGLAVLAGPARLRAAGATLIVGMLTVFTLAISLIWCAASRRRAAASPRARTAAVSDGWNLVRNGALIWLGLAVLRDAFRRVCARSAGGTA
jgi:uncharacterized membrane protein YphA (DoxX/SURF4 family)